MRPSGRLAHPFFLSINEVASVNAGDRTTDNFSEFKVRQGTMLPFDAGSSWKSNVITEISGTYLEHPSVGNWKIVDGSKPSQPLESVMLPGVGLVASNRLAVIAANRPLVASLWVNDLRDGRAKTGIHERDINLHEWITGIEAEVHALWVLGCAKEIWGIILHRLSDGGPFIKAVVLHTFVSIELPPMIDVDWLVI